MVLRQKKFHPQFLIFCKFLYTTFPSAKKLRIQSDLGDISTHSPSRLILKIPTTNKRFHDKDPPCVDCRNLKTERKKSKLLLLFISYWGVRRTLHGGEQIKFKKKLAISSKLC